MRRKTQPVNLEFGPLKQLVPNTITGFGEYQNERSSRAETSAIAIFSEKRLHVATGSDQTFFYVWNEAP